jgi:hypothetical protein
MSSELARQILGSLTMAPRLIETCNLSANDFPKGRYRQTFEILSALCESDRPEEIPLAILSERLGGDGAAAFTASLLDGLQTPTVENFAAVVSEMKRRRLSARIVTVAERLGREHLKTGAFDDKGFAELKKELEAIDALSPDHAGLPLTVLLSGVDPQPVEWLWPNFIPLARASMISGDPNVGKTWLALDIAARLSKGLAWPDDSPGPDPANVLYLTVEDNPHDTIRPRIDSLGGDPSKIAIINPGYSDFISFAEQGGIKKLEKEILKIGNVRLVVLDPVLDFSGGINPNAAEQVRAFLTPLIHIAEKLNLALLLIAHLNKAQSQSAIYRTGGSTSAWLGKCRAAFMIFRDSEEKKKRYVSAIKANLAPDDPPQLSFIPNSGRLVFERVIEEVDVDEHLNPQFRGQGGEKEESSFAVSWLKDALKAGPVDAKEIKQAAREGGISERSLNRAGHKLNVTMKAEGYGKFKTSTWALRETVNVQ